MAEGWGVTDVKAELTKSNIDADGNLTLTFTIAASHKYDVLPITDIKGRVFKLAIECLSRRVFAGAAGVAEVDERRRVRREARAKAEARDAASEVESP